MNYYKSNKSNKPNKSKTPVPNKPAPTVHRIPSEPVRSVQQQEGALDSTVAVPEPSTTQSAKAIQPQLKTGEAVTAASVDRKPVRRGKNTTVSKPKVEIETLEQFIDYAFSRKGQRIKLSSKIERLIAQNHRLDETATNRLLSLADTNAQLPVLLQLLFVVREIQGFPALKGAISNFVSTAMSRHPVFSDLGVRDALRNLPDAPSPDMVLKYVVGYEPTSTPDENKPKYAELQELRQNSINLFVAWLANNRGLNPEDLCKLLFQAVWAPAARELTDDNARLHALTEIKPAAGVGLACDKFRQNTIEAVTARDHAEREAAALRESVAELRLRLEKTENERANLVSELEALKASSASDLEQAQKQHNVERIHLQHNEEQLRGKLVRKLNESIDMLEVGLTALRNKTPRIEVMAERAEYVIDALRDEVSNLKGE